MTEGDLFGCMLLIVFTLCLLVMAIEAILPDKVNTYFKTVETLKQTPEGKFFVSYDVEINHFWCGKIVLTNTYLCLSKEELLDVRINEKKIGKEIELTYKLELKK